MLTAIKFFTQIKFHDNYWFLFTLCSLFPIRVTFRIVGHHFSNSLFQLQIVDLGTITKWGPGMLRKCFK